MHTFATILATTIVLFNITLAHPGLARCYSRGLNVLGDHETVGPCSFHPHALQPQAGLGSHSQADRTLHQQNHPAKERTVHSKAALASHTQADRTLQRLGQFGRDSVVPSEADLASQPQADRTLRRLDQFGRDPVVPEVPDEQ